MSDRATDDSPIAQLTRERDSEKARADAAEARVKELQQDAAISGILATNEAAEEIERLTADRDAWKSRVEAILANLGTIECPVCDSDPSCEECGGRGVIPRVGEWSDYAVPMPPPDHIGDANKMATPEAGEVASVVQALRDSARYSMYVNKHQKRLLQAAALIESQARRIEAVNELAHQLDCANQDRDRLTAALAECRSNLHDAIKTGGKLIEEHRAALAERDREIERVRGALLEIEWQHNPLIEIRKWRPACGNHDLDGHDDDCVIDAALKPTGGAAT